MARRRKRTVLSATMEEQIQKAQEKVIKTKASYDAAVKSLQVLLDKRDAQRKDELWNAIVKSKNEMCRRHNWIRLQADISGQEVP